MHIQIISSIIGWFVTTLGIATKVALAAKATTAAAAATKVALVAKATTATEITGAVTTTSLIWRNGIPLGPFPIQPMTPEQWKLIIESTKNTPHEIYNLYQSIPPEVFKWILDIGSIGYGASGVYEGYKVTKDMSDNLNDPVPILVG